MKEKSSAKIVKCLKCIPPPWLSLIHAEWVSLPSLPLEVSVWCSPPKHYSWVNRFNFPNRTGGPCNKAREKKKERDGPLCTAGGTLNAWLHLHLFRPSSCIILLMRSHVVLVFQLIPIEPNIFWVTINWRITDSVYLHMLADMKIKKLQYVNVLIIVWTRKVN